jgi:hypothetical protein
MGRIKLRMQKPAHQNNRHQAQAAPQLPNP